MNSIALFLSLVTSSRSFVSSISPSPSIPKVLRKASSYDANAIAFSTAVNGGVPASSTSSGDIPDSSCSLTLCFTRSTTSLGMPSTSCDIISDNFVYCMSGRFTSDIKAEYMAISGNIILSNLSIGCI